MKETFCRIKAVHQAIAEFERTLTERHGVSLNEAMLLCSLASQSPLSAGSIALQLGLSHSNASKLIRSAENKQLIARTLNQADRRGMLFELTPQGCRRLEQINAQPLPIPDALCHRKGEKEWRNS